MMWETIFTHSGTAKKKVFKSKDWQDFVQKKESAKFSIFLTSLVGKC